jgi:hypothetical protein
MEYTFPLFVLIGITAFFLSTACTAIMQTSCENLNLGIRIVILIFVVFYICMVWVMQVMMQAKTSAPQQKCMKWSSQFKQKDLEGKSTVEV